MILMSVFSVLLSSFPTVNVDHSYFLFCVYEASLPYSKSAVLMQLPHPGTLSTFHSACTSFCFGLFWSWGSWQEKFVSCKVQVRLGGTGEELEYKNAVLLLLGALGVRRWFRAQSYAFGPCGPRLKFCISPAMNGWLGSQQQSASLSKTNIDKFMKLSAHKHSYRNYHCDQLAGKDPFGSEPWFISHVSQCG